MTPPLNVEGQKKFCSQFQRLLQQSISRDKLRQTVTRFCETSMEVLPVREAYWLFCIPLIHLLSGQMPFEVTRFSLEEKPRFEDKGLDDIVNKTAQQLGSISHFPFLENHLCFFKLDTLLPSTLTACVPAGKLMIFFKERLWVSRDVVIAAIMRHLCKNTKVDATFENDLCHLLTHMAKDMSKENTTLPVSNISSDDELAEKYTTARQTRRAAEQLCDILNQQEHPIGTLIDSLRLFVVAVREQGRLIPLLKNTKGDAYKMTELDEPFSKIMLVTEQLFTRCEGNIEILAKTADRCMDFERIGVSSGNRNIMALVKTWETSICNHFRQSVEKVPAHSLLTYYCKADKHSVQLDGILTEILEERLEEAYNHNDGKDFWKLGPAFWRIYSKVLENKMKSLSPRDVPLYCTVLDWRILLPGLNMLVKRKTFGVTEEAMEILVEVRAAITSLIGSLDSEQILVRDLNVIKSKRMSFQTFAPVLGYKFSAMEGRMQSCFEAVDKFKITCESISSFLETTNEEIEEETELLDYLKICDNITIKTIRQLKEKQSDLSKLLGISSKELRKITSCMESLSFRKIWNDKKSNMSNRLHSATEARRTFIRTWSDLMHWVWKPTFQEWRNFGHCIQTGDITLEEVTGKIGIQIQNKKDMTNQLRKEFAILDRELEHLRLAEVTEKRLTAINDVFDIQNSVKISEIIMKIKETYGFTGNFSIIAAMMKMEKKGIVLRLVDRKTVDLSKLLASLPPTMYKCLKSFNKCRRLVEWIKTTMKEQNDIKTFVDLALMAIGESDLDIAVVRCLHSAALGYSRLIFMPTHSTVEDFLIRLKDVQMAFENDPQLHKKLEDAKASVNKLKFIHTTQRATSDKKSLKQAGQVIEFGTCYVGFHGGTDLVLPNVIRICVQNEKDGEINFSFADLEDIQSRLMLAGSSEDLKDPKTKDSMSKEETIEKFTMIFDSLRRLGLVYIRLNELGCLFFSQMDVVVCGHTGDRDVCKLSFCGKAALTVVKQENDTLDMSVIVKNIAGAFENCLETWNDEIKKARKDFYFLNHFTTKQLILLQDIVNDTSSEQVGQHVLPLLSLVLPGCSRKQMTTAFEEVFTKERPRQGPETSSKPIFTLLTDLVHEMTEEVNGTSNVEHMLEIFNTLWEVFVTTLTDTSSDFLSLGRLGEILTILGQKVPKEYRIDRSLPEPLRRGEPNLIVCPEADIINASLSVYLLDKNTTRNPLPRPEEILMCTSETTLDEVEAFFRRSLQKHPTKEKKIYTMMYADQLSIDVSCEAETILKKLQAGKKNEFQLVVLSSKENENKSVMAAALEKYRRLFPVLSSDIKDYVTKKLVHDGRSTVDVVISKRAGQGKTLYKNKILRELRKTQNTDMCSIGIPMNEQAVDVEQVMSTLHDYIGSSDKRLLHIDIAPVVQSGVDYLIFHLLIVGCLSSRSGIVWLKSDKDLYVVECLQSSIMHTEGKPSVVHKTLCILPTKRCISPREWLSHSYKEPQEMIVGFCEEEYRTNTFQVPYDHLRRPREEKSMEHCISTLLRNCGVGDPSWAELKQFVSFLHVQLTDYKKSIFCDPMVEPDLPGFANFVKRFMIQMSQDFATRSLHMSEESFEQVERQQNANQDGLQPFQMKRRWETSPHPYLFFNEDKNTVTFLGFNLRKGQHDLYDLVDNQKGSNGTILVQGIMHKALYDSLIRQRVPLDENIADLPRTQRLEKLRRVMGIKENGDPDASYELTSDNMKKILAIYMRFRCNIPVIIMGETGCGKTSLVKFMCQLQCPATDVVRNMILMKVHGGTTKFDIIKTVQKADQIAEENKKKYGSGFLTVLFFDEANTTEAISFIKEIICDQTMNGKKLVVTENLKFIAACNPYRKHSADMIKRLEKAGLGYHVKQDETTDKLGHIPMRHLVYRVHPLPHSMLPLVWDFGQLNQDMERQYITQMVAKQTPLQISGRANTASQIRRISALAASKQEDTVVVSILLASQSYMRAQEDECSFVSLRDVQRTLQVMSWFINQGTLLRAMEERMTNKGNPAFDSIGTKTRALVLALGVCYLSALKDKDKYIKHISATFRGNCLLPGGAGRFEQEIRICQEIILDEATIGPNIARNQALNENVFMMTVCIELRIPLFLVGKPGSSKSLAKAILADTMQGAASKKDLFKTFKQVQMVSYQCSPLSTSEGIIRTFKQASEFQKLQDLQKFVAVVVLDEIGLAEDSPHMPLKALHPLLEDGTNEDLLPHESNAYKKVSFLGISNWALDPAKMNRGILVQRNIPSVEELIESARGICETDKSVQQRVAPYLSQVAGAFSNISTGRLTKREFFGLRDFYGLIKMMYAFISTSNNPLTTFELRHSILRNFGGLDEVKPLEIFSSHLQFPNTKPRSSDPDCSQMGLIKAALTFKEAVDGLENRYLLLLTENYSFLSMLQHQILTVKNLRLTTLFGSSFPKDQEYTQICRNINRIKLCMESGQAVLLLNLENLYESLYDVLNQYYVLYGGERYVDLGLGTNRMKCKVHPNFRLIVVAEKQVVYETFPVPLINRLEKHLLRADMLLTEEQSNLSKELDDWMVTCTTNGSHRDLTCADVFIGYSSDMAPLTILKIWGDDMQNKQKSSDQKILETCKETVMKTSTPDGILRLGQSASSSKETNYQDLYFNGMHDSVVGLLESFNVKEITSDLFIQVTTYSQLLPATAKDDICVLFKLRPFQVEILNVKAFDTDQEFCKKIRGFVSALEFEPETQQKVLILQCDSGDQNSNLIACARHRLQDVIHDMGSKKEFTLCVILVIQLPNIKGSCFTGFQSGQWMSVHIDDINMETKKRDLRGICQMTYVELLQKSIVSGQQQTAIDISQLLKNCLCLSLAKVKDPDQERSNRGLKRISYVMDLIQLKPNSENNQGSVTFVDGIVNIILSLQKQKDERMAKVSGQAPKIAREACNSDSVRRAGTFRRSVTRSIETRISTSLSYAIAYLDTNQNLDLITSASSLDERISWAATFFLKVLNNNESLMLQYKDMLSTGGKEPSLFYVKTTGYKDQAFPAKMPFSWIIFANIDKIYRRIAADKEHEFSNSEVAKIVSTTLSIVGDLDGSLTSKEERAEATRQYLHDFIHMTFQCETHSVTKILETTFHQACKEKGYNIYASNMALNLVNIHHIRTVLYERLENFQMLRRMWPQCDVYVNREMKSEGNEVMFDVVALRGQVEDLSEACGTVEAGNWLTRVDRCALLIATILKGDGHTTGYGKTCVEMLTTIRKEWNRVLALKMLYEEVTLKSETELKQVFDMRTVLEPLKTFSLKEKSGLEKLDEFMKSCKAAALKHTTKNTEEADGRHIDNFYMRVVSQLCFANNTPPSDEVVKMLLDHMTSGLTANEDDRLQTFSTGAGTKTTAKSFFLQLLLRTRGDLVKRHIERFFHQARSGLINLLKRFVGSGTNPADIRILEFCSMVVKCIEDSYRARLTEKDPLFAQEIQEALHKLTWASEQQFQSGLHYGNLEIIASMQFGLKITSTCLQKCFVEKTEGRSEAVVKLLSAAKIICTQKGMSYPHEYLIRDLCEKYGNSSYQYLVKDIATMDRSVTWFALCPATKGNLECEHRYLVCGPQYKKVRNDLKDTIQQILKDQNQTPTHHGMDSQMHTIFLTLAVHREITLAYLQGSILYHTEIKSRIIENLQGKVAEQQNITAHVCDLVNNQTAKSMSYLSFREGLDLQQQGIICLLEHMYVLLVVLEDSNSLLSPFAKVALAPKCMQKAYLPTMPEEVNYKQMLTEIRRADPGATLNVCPNGHPYIIANCGRPWVESKCTECGAAIGGTGHKFSKGNRKVQESDFVTDPTQDQGHVLGDPTTRTASSAVRDLTPVSSGILRLFTHAALLLGANTNPQRILSMIKPTIAFGELQGFLVGHLRRDIDNLHRDLARSHDDVFLLCHYALDVISRGCLSGSLRSSESTLESSQRRTTWERIIQTNVLMRIARDSGQILKTCRENLKGENETGGSSVQLSALLETDWGLDSNPSCDNAHESCILWKRHGRVSVEGFVTDFLSGKLTDEQNNQSLLAHFITKLDRMQLVKHLPDILDLQRSLLRMFKRKMDRTGAKETSIKQFLIDMKKHNNIDERDMDNIRKQIHICMDVWTKMNEYLQNYGLVIEKKGFTVRRVVPSSIRKLTITYESPLELLLPSVDGQGLCAFVLVEFLIRTQNDFIEEYCRICNIQFADIPLVYPKDVIQANVIIVDKNAHLLPLILSNCKYEVDAEKGQRFEYDIEGIARQLKDRFISGRSRIAIKSIPTMMYRSDTAETWSHKQLTEVLPQVPMSETLKEMVLADLLSLPRLYQALDNLDMTISLLCCLPKGVDNSDRSLFDFMTKTLRMPDTELGQQVERSCRFKHVVSLWLALSMKKDFLLQRNNQDAFQCLEMKFKTEQLDGNMQKQYQEFLRNLTKSNQRQLIETLYECIVLRFPSDETDEEQLDYTRMSLSNVLYGHVSAPIYDEKQTRDAGIVLLDEDDDAILNFPPDLEGSKAVAAWSMAMDLFQAGQ
ncbi:E3 ubiquitin-protein ligase rnf213-alpha-like isoform X2 [Mizuhopecten yessoensis]|uniref:E3 ubiquitin-protein ligase rnf213-alpha-like isoform X2 n=1 Tax=Mizuhopecten yessoensis TaxID=6573 RepID=UPI000B457FB5|nr:E3 ubiquitin-protein ligase rnf213-alpha-like isoform X2 [Mizuhopecten yessoensis]